MPYFRDAGVLYLHVPKTGGMSVEKYLYARSAVPRDHTSGYGYRIPGTNLRDIFGTDAEHTLQHMTYRQLETHGHLFGLDVSDPALTVIATVRNPYYRVVSDMFFFVTYTGVTSASSPEDIELAIIKYLMNPAYDYDNHRLSQYEFLKDSSGNIPKHMRILRCETLCRDMRATGFADFGEYENCNRTGLSHNSYMSLLTLTAQRFIEEYYAIDFEKFSYLKN